MKRLLLGFLLGVLVGAFGVYGFFSYSKRKYATPAVCYSCFWKGQSTALRKDLTDFYQQYRNPDELVMSDVSFILWRATDQPNCDVREQYRAVAENEVDPYRKFMARGILAFSGPECGEQNSLDYAAAAETARQ